MHRYIYTLKHAHEYLSGEKEWKFIGIYTSREEADKAIKRASKQPGFCDCPEGFYIEEYKIDDDHYMKKKSTLATQG